jgi:hypothetical protein
MSSNGPEKEINDNTMPLSIPEEGLESAEKVLNLQIDADDIRRCIGCPLVEKCIEKAEDNSDPLTSDAYLRYAKKIQDGCQGPKEEPSLFLRRRTVLCGSPAVKDLTNKLRHSL